MCIRDRPGIDTIPIVSILFMVGNIALSKASLTMDLDAAFGVAPSIRELSITARLFFISLQRRLAPNAIPVMEFPMIIPEMGMQYWG